MKKVLILGGSGFVGRNITNSFISNKNFSVTLFNRGVSNPNLFQEANHINGDRNILNDVNKLATQDWDYVIDVNCYFPSQLKMMLETLSANISNYIFISTCSVYDNDQFEGMCRTEEAHTLSCSAKEAADDVVETYGNRKAECERILKLSGKPHVIFRPALIYGPHDQTDRLYYWIHQVKTYDEILLPEKGEKQFSITFIDDLVKAIQSCISLPITNEIFNIISCETTSIKEIVTDCEVMLKKLVKKINAPSEIFKAKGLREWMDIPLWISSNQFTFSNRKMMDCINIKPTSIKVGLEKTIGYYDEKKFPTPIYGINNYTKQILLDEIRK